MHSSYRAVAETPTRLPDADGHASAFRGRHSTPTPVTAARLAAEALFAVRTESAPAQPVQVTVLRKRARLAPESATGATAPAAIESAADEALRAPRIFTLRRPQAASDSALPQPAEHAWPAPDAPAAVPVLAPRTSRRDRIGHDTRTRVVRYVKLPPAVVHRPDGADTLRHLSDGLCAADAGVPRFDGAPGLLRQLAQAVSSFETIRQAQAFTLRDEAIEREWRRVARAADALARELLTALAAQDS